MAKVKVEKNDEQLQSDVHTEKMVTVEYIKDGYQAKKGEKIKVTEEYAKALKENGWIK